MTKKTNAEWQFIAYKNDLIMDYGDESSVTELAELLGWNVMRCSEALVLNIQRAGVGVNWWCVLESYWAEHYWIACTKAEYDLALAANYMDDDIREELHFDPDFCDDAIEFLAEYERRHEAKFGEEFIVN